MPAGKFPPQDVKISQNSAARDPESELGGGKARAGSIPPFSSRTAMTLDGGELARGNWRAGIAGMAVDR